MTISVRVCVYLSINDRGDPLPHPQGKGMGRGRDLWNDADRDISRFRRPHSAVDADAAAADAVADAAVAIAYVSQSPYDQSHTPR